MPSHAPCPPAQLGALRRLELQYNRFEGGAPPLLGELTALEELNLGGNLWGGAAPDLPPAYAQLRRLRCLTLTNCELGALPPVARGLSSLQLLKVGSFVPPSSGSRGLHSEAAAEV